MILRNSLFKSRRYTIKGNLVILMEIGRGFEKYTSIVPILIIIYINLYRSFFKEGQTGAGGLKFQMQKKLIYYFFILVFFVIYFKIFSYLYRQILILVNPSFLNVLVMGQIFILIVILVPASVATTRKVFEIIKSP